MRPPAPILVIAAALAFANVVKAQSIPINEGLSGAWFDPETSGQGVLFDVVPAENLVFMAWFTYETASGKLGPTEARWLTAQGGIDGTRAVLVVNNTTGGAFDDPTPVETAPVGSATVEFLSCTTALLEFDFPDDGLAGAINLVRLAPDVFCSDLVATE
ncbi:MAG: hypothetical protein AAGE01_15970 [Pseudomonadota bacterium]